MKIVVCSMRQQARESLRLLSSLSDGILIQSSSSNKKDVFPIINLHFWRFDRDVPSAESIVAVQLSCLFCLQARTRFELVRVYVRYIGMHTVA